MSRTLALTLLSLSSAAWNAAWAAPACTVSATPVSFGAYDHLNLLPNDSSGTLTVECQEVGMLTLDTLVNYTIELDTGGAASYLPRAMTNAGDTLDYNLYTDISRSAIWGDGTGGTFTVMNSLLVPGCVLMVCPTVSQNETVYGRIPASQIIPGGSYTDTITVTVDY